MSNLSHPFRWLQCVDGSIPTALDILHLPFPNRGYKELPKLREICWEGKLFEPPSALKPYVESYDHSHPLRTLSELYDCVMCLLLSSAICLVACVLIYLLLNKLHTKFSQINPPHKKWYVVVNVMKGVVLGLMVANSKFLPGSAKIVFGGEAAILETKRTTALYVMTDLVGIILVPKLPLSTLMHHYMTILIGLGIWSNNIGADTWEGMVGVTKMAFMYGSFSCIPFAVNIFLGLRVMFEKNLWMIFNCYFGLIAYIASISLNWSLHISWLYYCFTNWDLSVWFFLYCGILAHIIRDDIKLVKYLWNYPSTKKVAEKIE